MSAAGKDLDSANVTVVIACVDYADMLAVTLPYTTKLFDDVTIVTKASDLESVRVAKNCGAKVFISDDWYLGGALFNKSGALNSCLRVRNALSRNGGWILLLDADIVMFDVPRTDLETLDRRKLYSVRRRLCETQQAWLDFVSEKRKLSSFPLDTVPIVNGRAWGEYRTENAAALSGYFHLWYHDSATELKELPSSRNAGKYDVLFALTFPDEHRAYIENQEVLHLGERRRNWNGRTSDRWRA